MTSPFLENMVKWEREASKEKEVCCVCGEFAEQRVAQATAEATAIKIQAEAITQQGGQDYVALKTIKWCKREIKEYEKLIKILENKLNK